MGIKVMPGADIQVFSSVFTAPQPRPISTYAMFFMIDEGMAKTLTTSTVKDSIYVFTFNQEDLMASFGIQGAKITKLNPKKIIFTATFSIADILTLSYPKSP